MRVGFFHSVDPRDERGRTASAAPSSSAHSIKPNPVRFFSLPGFCYSRCSSRCVHIACTADRPQGPFSGSRGVPSPVAPQRARLPASGEVVSEFGVREGGQRQRPSVPPGLGCLENATGSGWRTCVDGSLLQPPTPSVCLRLGSLGPILNYVSKHNAHPANE